MIWQTKKLGEICSIQTGKWDANHAVVDGEYRFFTCAYDHMLCNTKRFSGECLILPGNGVNVGEVFYYSGDFDAYQRTYVINNIKIFPKFLYYHLLCFWKERNLHKQFGSATNFLKIGNFLDYEVYYPESIAEQKRIVKILDETFEKIKKTKENTEKNIKNSKELFESYLQNIFANPGKDWEDKKIKEIGVTQTGLTPKTSDKKYYGDHVPFITPADIDILGDGSVRYNSRGLSEAGLDVGRKIDQNSILMVCIGATIGKVGFVTQDVSCNQQINTLTPKSIYYQKFFYYALRTEIFYNKVIKNSSQATLPIINKGKWENISVIFPKSIIEQKSIVKKLDELSEETKKLEEIYKQKLINLEELKKSILSKAFKGEL